VDIGSSRFGYGRNTRSAFSIAMIDAITLTP